MFILFFSKTLSPNLYSLLPNLYRPHYALCIMHCALTFPCSFPDLTLLLSQICHNFVAGLSRVIRGSSPPTLHYPTLHCPKLSTLNTQPLSTLHFFQLSTINYQLFLLAIKQNSFCNFPLKRLSSM